MDNKPRPRVGNYALLTAAVIAVTLRGLRKDGGMFGNARNRIGLAWGVCVTLMTVSQSALAQNNPYAACAAIADRAARYACYDAVEGRAPSSVTPPSPMAPPVAARPQPAAPQAPASQALDNPFAHSQGTTPAPVREPSRILSDIQSFSFDTAGKFTVVLANGQVWHQFDADSGNAAFKQHSRNVAKITHGFWKTYNLQINGQSAVYRVVRLK